jgi:hypothetical protein
MVGQSKKIAAERCVYIFGPLCTWKVAVVTDMRYSPGIYPEGTRKITENPKFICSPVSDLNAVTPE